MVDVAAKEALDLLLELEAAREEADELLELLAVLGVVLADQEDRQAVDAVDLRALRAARLRLEHHTARDVLTVIDDELRRGAVLLRCEEVVDELALELQAVALVDDPDCCKNEEGITAGAGAYKGQSGRGSAARTARRPAPCSRG